MIPAPVFDDKIGFAMALQGNYPNLGQRSWLPAVANLKREKEKTASHQIMHMHQGAVERDIYFA